jgi:hypothetical protein
MFDFKKVNCIFKREVLYNIFIEFSTAEKLHVVRPIEIFSNKICVDRSSHDTFCIQNILKQRDALSPLLFTSSLDYCIRKAWENQEEWK